MKTLLNDKQTHQDRLATYEISPRMQVSKRKNLGTLSNAKQIMIGSSIFVINGSDQLQTGETIENADSKALTEIEEGDNLLNRAEYSCQLHQVLRVTKKSRLTGSASAVNLSQLAHAEHAKSSELISDTMRRENSKSMRNSISAPSLLSIEASDSDGSDVIKNVEITNPETLLRKIIQDNTGRAIENHAALDLKGFFLEVTEEHISSYSADMVSAVRRQDVEYLRKMSADGKTLQCCNRFGESIVHMACRNGLFDVLTFLLEEACVSFLVIDDYGRTPLHDAFWTREPELEIVKFLILKCPDLLLVADKRGFTPLSYVRQDHWGTWRQFLLENAEILTPKKLL
mmetsp:Transcript_2312/g.3497  ORF Transcript_2312/g.3497 Transcript_2312/m.3497 type:complete len:343 (-) Transcript_2312:53-1081(-)